MESTKMINRITSLWGNGNESELHQELIELKAKIKAEMLEEMQKAIKTIDTFYN